MEKHYGSMDFWVVYVNGFFYLQIILCYIFDES